MRLLLSRLGLTLGAFLAPAGESLGTTEPLTIVTLGTSLTEGIEWPQRLRDRLSACLGRPVRVESAARSGMTSEWGLAQVGRVASLRPQVVLIEFAMNDANWRRFVTRARSRANTVAIVRALRDRLPGSRIVLMTTNVVHGLRGLMRPNVAAYYRQYREIASAEGIDLIDLEPRWAALDSRALRRAIPDGVHPTLKAFEEVALPQIVSVLSGGRCL